MADYWLAPSLEVFRAEANALYPDRDKTSDGWIGDKKHAASDSDHNPEGWRGNPKRWAGVVRAFDIDNDLAVGKNAQSMADYLASQLGKHPALGPGAYLIYNGRIISTDRLSEGWRKYSGKNPHKGHIHISVGRSPSAYNSRAPWGLGGNPVPEPESEEDDMYPSNKMVFKTENGVETNMVHNPGSGWFHEFQVAKGAGGDSYINAVAGLYETGNRVGITPSHYAVIKAGLERLNDLDVTVEPAQVDAAKAPK